MPNDAARRAAKARMLDEVDYVSAILLFTALPALLVYVLRALWRRVRGK